MLESALRIPIGVADMYKRIKQTNAPIALSIQQIADKPDTIARVGNGLEGTRSVRLPEDERILVLEASPGMAVLYQGGFIGSLKPKNQVLLFTVSSGMDKESIIRALAEFNPSIIMLPEQSLADANSRIIKEAVDLWAGKQYAPVLGFSYATRESLAEQGNLYVYFGERELGRKEAATLAHRSQVDRLPYHTATSAANRARALIGESRYPGISGGKSSAEIYVLRAMVNGNWEGWDIGSPDSVYAFNQARGGNYRALSFGEGAALFVASPHMDDLCIATGAFAQMFNEKIDFIFTTGHRAFIEGISNKSFKTREDFSGEQLLMLREILGEDLYLPRGRKEALKDIVAKLEAGQGLDDSEEKLVKIALCMKVREREMIESDHILGVQSTVFCRFPFYEHNSEIGHDEHYNEVDVTYNALKDAYKKYGEKLVVAIPHPHDAHPNHRATHKVMEDALGRLTKELQVKVPVVMYTSPWFGNGNVYNYISEKEQSVKLAGDDTGIGSWIANSENSQGIVGGELVLTAFGQTPPYEALGGQLSERLYVYWINSGQISSQPQAYRTNI